MRNTKYTKRPTKVWINFLMDLFDFLDVKYFKKIDVNKDCNLLTVVDCLQGITKISVVNSKVNRQLSGPS